MQMRVFLRRIRRHQRRPRGGGRGAAAPAGGSRAVGPPTERRQRLHPDAPRPRRVHQLLTVRHAPGHRQQLAALRGAAPQGSPGKAGADALPAAVQRRGSAAADPEPADIGQDYG